MSARQRQEPLRRFPYPRAGLVAGAAIIILGTASPSRSEGFVAPVRDAPATVWAVGDGADGSAGAISVGDLIERGSPDRFLYLGDVYTEGTAEEFTDHYATVYGPLDQITAPTPGNHEWDKRGVGYYPYWSGVTGQAVPDWYAFRVAGWQLLSLNSEAAHEEGSAQLRWLKQTLRGTRGPGTCRIAFWHRPLYSAGTNGDQADVEPLWNALEGSASIVINGHDHDMQRHRRRRGIVEFVAGSGGHDLRDVDEADPRLAFAADQTLGALRLVLRRRRASYAFVALDGTVLDAGTKRCRRRGERPRRSARHDSLRHASRATSAQISEVGRSPSMMRTPISRALSW